MSMESDLRESKDYKLYTQVKYSVAYCCYPYKGNFKEKLNKIKTTILFQLITSFNCMVSIGKFLKNTNLFSSQIFHV